MTKHHYTNSYNARIIKDLCLRSCLYSWVLWHCWLVTGRACKNNCANNPQDSLSEQGRTGINLGSPRSRTAGQQWWIFWLSVGKSAHLQSWRRRIQLAHAGHTLCIVVSVAISSAQQAAGWATACELCLIHLFTMPRSKEAQTTTTPLTKSIPSHKPICTLI